MAVRSILRFPDPKLRQKSDEVGEIGDDVRQLVADMAETMIACQRRRAGRDPGRGSAAAVHRRRARDGRRRGFAAEGVHQPRDRLEISDEAQTGDEGCLSFPDVFVPVKRGMRARVRARDLDGNIFEDEGEGLYARALQHETDHLNGRLLIDQVGPVKREIIKRKLRKDAQIGEQEEQEEAAERAAAGQKRSVG